MNDTVYKLRIAKFNNAHLSDVKKNNLSFRFTTQQIICALRRLCSLKFLDFSRGLSPCFHKNVKSKRCFWKKLML